jgi:hypothetical protein
LVAPGAVGEKVNWYGRGRLGVATVITSCEALVLDRANVTTSVTEWLP